MAILEDTQNQGIANVLGGRIRKSRFVDSVCSSRIVSYIVFNSSLIGIELGEIDTYISHHPLVRENVTLVRRDKDEEPTLVSYIVPDLSRWSLWLDSQGLPPDVEDDSMSGMLRRFTLLRDDVKADLRKKLPVHAIPSVIIPLKRMPLVCHRPRSSHLKAYFKVYGVINQEALTLISHRPQMQRYRPPSDILFPFPPRKK